MNRTKTSLAALLAVTLTMQSASMILPAAAEGSSYPMQVNIDVGGASKEISPYIYGINIYGNSDYLDEITAHAVRQGGNRMTAYNWETNASNAGSDWKHSSDNNLSNSDRPADCVQTFSADAQKYGYDYKLTTLQMAGYVAADKNGTVNEDEIAPSDRWNRVAFEKGSAYAETPDLTDGVVYMDEYVNYILRQLGDASTATGMQGYSLDNEPALWSSTHGRMHPNPVTMAEMNEKSIALAKVVKQLDPKAEVFGPALYGYTAYDHLGDDDSSNEWETIQAAGNYHWYLDYYLESMRKASEEAGVRLLDVLDIHYYSESSRVGDEDRVQSVRTLYEKGFIENSWIGQWCQQNVPILPTVQNSIDTYYPGTKLAISEYNFGGENATATIAQAEALGCFADQGVYFASIWGGNDFQFAGLNLYTNYDGKGGHFGNMLLPAKTADVSLASTYAAMEGKEQGTVTAMLTNKSFTEEEQATITLENAKTNYQAAAVYAVTGDDSGIRLIDIIEDVQKNTVTVKLPAMTAAMIVVTDDASDFAGLSTYVPEEVHERIVTIEDPQDHINKNGYVEFPIDDPEHLKRVVLTADVTSPMGSGWGTAGCALSINAVDAAGTKFWTSKGYTLGLGKNTTATIEFDGTFDNDGETVEAVIADGKIELQQWWEDSEKHADGDKLSVTYTKIEVVYEETTGLPAAPGDVNADGKISIADAVLMQHYLLGSEKKLADWKAGDLNEDGKLDARDFTLLKRALQHKA